MGFDVTKGAAYAVLYSVLFFFSMVAISSADLIQWLPNYLARFVTLKKRDDGTPDYFLSARNSVGTWSIALSFFASGMGAWVLYGTTEMGATPQLSWFAVLGYSGASAFPAAIVSWIGPKVRARSTKAFSSTDFGRERYGRVMQIVIATVSIFYMFIYLVAEFTSISNVFGLLSNNESKEFGIGVTVSIGVITIIYTTVAGYPASIVTDRFQGVIMSILVLLILVAVSANPANHVTREEFALASNWTGQGLKAAVTLFIAISCAEMFNQGTWQRVWAADTVTSMRRGFFLGSIFVFLLMMFFGVMAMIAYAKDPEAYDSGEKYAYLAFFDILEPLKVGWQILVLILTTALCSSTVDSLQTALASIFARDLVKYGWNPKFVARALIALINVPAVWLASLRYDVIALFLVADLVCSTSVLPVFLGLQTNDFGLLKAPTELGALLGCLSGVATVLINGAINNVDGNVFQYFWLRNGGICSLCGNKTMVSFIVTPIMGGVMTYVFSFLDVAIRGERARQPLISIPFDKEDAEKEDAESSEGGADDLDKTNAAELGTPSADVKDEEVADDDAKGGEA